MSTASTVEPDINQRYRQNCATKIMNVTTAKLNNSCWSPVIIIIF